MHLFNNGSANLMWGDSSIGINSSGVIFPLAARNWQNMEDGWFTYVLAESAATNITITEYRGV